MNFDSQNPISIKKDCIEKVAAENCFNGFDPIWKELVGMEWSLGYPSPIFDM